MLTRLDKELTGSQSMLFVYAQLSKKMSTIALCSRKRHNKGLWLAIVCWDEGMARKRNGRRATKIFFMDSFLLAEMSHCRHRCLGCLARSSASSILPNRLNAGPHLWRSSGNGSKDLDRVELEKPKSHYSIILAGARSQRRCYWYKASQHQWVHTDELGLCRSMPSTEWPLHMSKL